MGSPGVVKNANAAPAELPESWEAWVGGAMKVLGDPKISSREAPFHLAQAKEGTGFFELPLPWGTAQAPLQIWIESGLPDRAQDPSGPEDLRVLIGLSFTALGETRVGLHRHRDGLQVRIWTERPDLLEGRLADLRRELEEGEQRLDLRILALGDRHSTVPSLRSLVAGTTYQALG